MQRCEPIIRGRDGVLIHATTLGGMIQHFQSFNAERGCCCSLKIRNRHLTVTKMRGYPISLSSGFA